LEEQTEGFYALGNVNYEAENYDSLLFALYFPIAFFDTTFIALETILVTCGTDVMAKPMSRDNFDLKS
jgi:hypothetical protein